MEQLSLDIVNLSTLYRGGKVTPDEVVAEIRQRIETHRDNPIWIHVLSEEEMAPYLKCLSGRRPEDLPLYGIPFAIKDNIDLANIPTTAGCPEYAYVPDGSATVVEALLGAGAIPIGKTNLDQFATGLVGTRSPYGACRNSFDPDYISGGSSSGSAVSVALGLVSFSLGTDTAGSGRVPASLNNLFGLKPTRGVLSTHGVVPACRSLDCVSIFALCSGDADAVLQVAAGYDENDPYSREAKWDSKQMGKAFRFGVLKPECREFFGNEEAAQLYESSIERMVQLGGDAVPVDYGLFNEVALLLYEGPWVAERYAAVGDFIAKQPDDVYPVTRKIIEGGAEYQAADAFAAFYRLQALQQKSAGIFEDIDFFMLPTNGTVYEVEEVLADPVQLNSNLGYYTNFMNLLDLCGVAVPFGFYEGGMPFGVTLAAPAFKDKELLRVAAQFECELPLKLGATDFYLEKSTPCFEEMGENASMIIAVCGAHMKGLPLNYQLTDIGATFVEITRTAACYQFYALTDKNPVRPGLVRVEKGESIELELWSVPLVTVGSFLSKIQSPLGLGRVLLEDGREVTGFVCESIVQSTAENISRFGSWRNYLNGLDL